MSTGFGQWYEEKKAEENGPNTTTTTSSSWGFGGEEGLPLFSTDSMSWSGMKESMESQMPKKIMGMGYQQRFKVSCTGEGAVAQRHHDGPRHSSSLILRPFHPDRYFAPSCFYPDCFSHSRFSWACPCLPSGLKSLHYPLPLVA